MALATTTPWTDRATDPPAGFEADIVVRGTGAAAGLLAAVLARGGRRVVLVVDPEGTRGASDLSTIPYSAELALLIADRFDVPEAASLALFECVAPELAEPSGEKTSLGFCHHRRGRCHEPAEAVQFQVPAEHAEWQPDRAALDAWAAGLAATHGAAILEGDVRELRSSAAEVCLELDDGRTVTAGVLVDATGGGRVVGRVESARVLSADLTGVARFEDIARGHPAGNVRPWSAGTLTHTFANGYLQVCHHGAGRPVGVTLVLSRAAADPELGAAAQVSDVLGGLPDLQAQLAGAELLGDWVDSWAPGRPRTAWEGERILELTGGGGGGPLFGRELTLGFEAVLAAGAALLAADRGAEHEALSTARERIGALAAHEDRYGAGFLAAAHDFGLVNALVRVWLLESIVRALALKRGRLDAKASGDFRSLDGGSGAFWFATPRGLRGLVEAALGDAEAVDRREVPCSTAAGRIFGRLGKSRITPPLFDFADPDARVYRFTTARRLRMLAWVTLRAPADFRGLLTSENVTAARPGVGRP